MRGKGGGEATGKGGKAGGGESRSQGAGDGGQGATGGCIGLKVECHQKVWDLSLGVLNTEHVTNLCMEAGVGVPCVSGIPCGLSKLVDYAIYTQHCELYALTRVTTAIYASWCEFYAVKRVTTP